MNNAAAPDQETMIDAGPLDRLPPGEQLVVPVRFGLSLLVCHDDESDRIWALENSCPHAFQPMTDGPVENGTIQCPKHGACFDLTTGASLNSITPHPIKLHRVEIRDGRILIAAQPNPLPGA